MSLRAFLSCIGDGRWRRAPPKLLHLILAQTPDNARHIITEPLIPRLRQLHLQFPLLRLLMHRSELEVGRVFHRERLLDIGLEALLAVHLRQAGGRLGVNTANLLHRLPVALR